ncbi:MAG: glycosyltransferase family 2 protein [Candidatus Limnocylindria bacterium]
MAIHQLAPPVAAEPAGPRPPRVTIGVPVYNGEAYIETALRSLLAQTFQDIEIVISDNASTDATEAICRRIAAQDSRVRYDRAPRNVGLVPNHRRVLAMATGEYFMFAPHDDWFAPDYVERAVEALDADPDVTFAHAVTVLVDEHGNEIGHERTRQRLQDPSPSTRFWDVLTVQGGINWYGLTRRRLMQRIGRYEAVPRSERIVIAELALWGPFALLPAGLYFRRIHEGQATALRRDRLAELRRLDPAKATGLRATTPAMLAEYVLLFAGAVARAPMSVRERVRAFLMIGRWMLAKFPPFRLRDPRTRDVDIARTGPGRLPGGRDNIGY